MLNSSFPNKCCKPSSPHCCSSLSFNYLVALCSQVLCSWIEMNRGHMAEHNYVQFFWTWTESMIQIEDAILKLIWRRVTIALLLQPPPSVPSGFVDKTPINETLPDLLTALYKIGITPWSIPSQDPILYNFPALMQPCQEDIQCILKWGGAVMEASLGQNPK